MSRAVLSLIALLIALANARITNRRPSSTLKMKSGLDLPHNATYIRENIVDNFSCENRIYGYYADIENECQIFHICFPQVQSTMRFSFICPGKTVFNQATFVCTRTENSIPCNESMKYYTLNEALGKIEEATDELDKDTESTLSLDNRSGTITTIKPQIEVHKLSRPIHGKKRTQ